MAVVRMPALGESVTEGTVIRWLKNVGDTVEHDEPLLEVSTDKVDSEIVAPAAGILEKITAGPDDVVPVGDPLGEIGEHSRTRASHAADNDLSSGADEVPLTVENSTDDSDTDGVLRHTRTLSSPRLLATPAARRRAHELGLALDAVASPAVPILLRHVEGSEASPAPEAPHPTTEVGDTGSAEQPAAPSRAVSPPTAGRSSTHPVSRVRRITAERTLASLRETAQLTQVFEVDLSAVAALRARAKGEFAQREGISLTFLPFIAKAVVEALVQHPNINASINTEHTMITHHDTVGLGIAVDTPAGLYSPVIAQADQLSVTGLAHAIGRVAAAARANKLTADQLGGGTFTITNIGSNGALFDTPILVNGQAGMLGFGAVVRRPTVCIDADGHESIGIRSMCYLPLTYDHRLVDGADAGRFLSTIKQRLETGDFHADLGLPG
ncbi:2-oxoglutarate dehydrogenase, E2 component, dihydrolipoamide succinyltransferase [Rhodococcus indonesiensis]